MDIDVIKRNSTYPPLSFDFVDDSGEAVDCAPYEVRLICKNFKNQIVINAVIGAEGGNGVWLDETLGQGEYQWSVEDTDTLGRFRYEFQFTRLYDNKMFSLPSDGYFVYGVVENIALPDEDPV